MALNLVSVSVYYLTFNVTCLSVLTVANNWRIESITESRKTVSADRRGHYDYHIILKSSLLCYLFLPEHVGLHVVVEHNVTRTMRVVHNA